ncbi:MAG: single-strand selective monofunctional uracil-DNA glycosylase [Deltaproteobacteria bacterium]|nr:MAG: single-strand selective monofunctional uracil-DNA glycosylase [Deltaproteobacteria bacterium]
MHPLVRIARRLAREVGSLRFGPPTTHVYNPLDYARVPHERYLRRYGNAPKEVVLVGMNPGPWGMAQTGVPFGEVSLVREWLGIDGPVERPAREHPKRPIEGFSCRRSEVSGSRLWGLARERFGTPETFFARFFVYNYCPLAFLEESGRNRTPDRLPARERAPLFSACDRALSEVLAYLQPKWVIGVGRFAFGRIEAVSQGAPWRTGQILHPSPASPKANRGWAKTVETQLAALGLSV